MKFIVDFYFLSKYFMLNIDYLTNAIEIAKRCSTDAITIEFEGDSDQIDIIFPGTMNVNGEIYNVYLPDDCLDLFSNIISEHDKTIRLLDISQLKTRENQTVILHSMFEGSGMKLVKLPEFEGDVIDMRRMFAYCTKLQTIDVSNFRGDALYTMDSMFLSCVNLHVIKGLDKLLLTNSVGTISMKDILSYTPLENNDVAKMTNIPNILKSPNIDEDECNKLLESLIAEKDENTNTEATECKKQDTADNINIGEMFEPNEVEFLKYCDFIKISHLNCIILFGLTEKAYKELSTFRVPKQIAGQSITLEITDKVTPTFSPKGLSENNLKKIDLTNLNLTGVTNLNEMFKENIGVEEVILPESMENIKSIENMFLGCINLKAVKNFSRLKVDTDFTSTFGENISIADLQLT